MRSCLGNKKKHLPPGVCTVNMFVRKVGNSRLTFMAVSVTGVVSRLTPDLEARAVLYLTKVIFGPSLKHFTQFGPPVVIMWFLTGNDVVCTLGCSDFSRAQMCCGDYSDYLVLDDLRDYRSTPLWLRQCQLRPCSLESLRELLSIE